MSATTPPYFTMALMPPLPDERILSISERVECLSDPDTAFPTFYSGGVIVTTANGEKHQRYHRVNKGAGERALSNDQIISKYMDNACWAFPRARAEQVRDVILTLEERNIAEIWKVLGGR